MCTHQGGKHSALWHAGGEVEIASIKEGALRVYSGQRLFPLTFQMPESGLALKERRWHASRRGGDVRLGSIAATDLEVYTCGVLALPHAVHLPGCHAVASRLPSVLQRWNLHTRHPVRHSAVMGSAMHYHLLYRALARVLQSTHAPQNLLSHPCRQMWSATLRCQISSEPRRPSSCTCR